jgi:short-subunit dehydrogenase
MDKNKLVILITGASSGIGRATAEHLTKLGHEVIGLSRKEPRSPYGFKHRSLDISIEADVKITIESIVKDHHRIDGLINCAGIGLSGPIEQTNLDQARRLFEVNLFGAFAMSKYCLPHLRENRGFIFNIGSVAGPITIPFQTFYSMSKSALQSFSEGLRMETRPWGVRVVTILPGDTKTEFTDRREKIPEDQLYGARLARSIAVMEQDERHGKSPMTVARAVAKLIKRKHPPVTVTVGFSYKILVWLSHRLPRRWTLAIINHIYGK